jgi:hypothetical protein
MGKMKPWIVNVRQKYSGPRLCEWFEHFRNEMKKREQQLAETK